MLKLMKVGNRGEGKHPNAPLATTLRVGTQTTKRTEYEKSDMFSNFRNQFPKEFIENVLLLYV